MSVIAPRMKVIGLPVREGRPPTNAIALLTRGKGPRTNAIWWPTRVSSPPMPATTKMPGGWPLNGGCALSWNSARSG